MQVVTTHKNTDFDGLASVIAATIIFPDAMPVLPKSINPNVKAFLSIHKDIFETYLPDQVDLDQVRKLIVVDVNSWERLGRLKRLQHATNLEIFLFDHHAGQGDIVPNYRCQEEIGANITLMIRKMKQTNMLITPIQATLFLAGLYEDTGNLTFPSSTAEDAYAAAYLLENKADLTIVNSFLRPAYGEKQKNILFQMLEAAKRVKVNGYRVSFSKVTVVGHVDSLAVVVRMYREILNVDAAFGIFFNPERRKSIVIGRSNIEGFDMGAIMRRLGGGGHPAAGSALVDVDDPARIQGVITDLITGGQQKQVQVSDLMSYPVITLTPQTSMADAAALLRTKGCTGVPVVENEALIGIISRRDFRKIKKESQLKAPVKAFMSTKIVSIEPGKSPQQAAQLMVKHDVGRLPVVEEGRIIGIITRSDTMRYFYDLLPD
jgi:nanoRNase/pAp phosphatase (c-di-AMP/oligoRNAs hydrolase)/CBS domain-containing protein